MLSTAHGTGLFQRGETQVLSVLTLGMPKMDQLLDNLGDKPKKRYMHHYNMPPHANGETGRVGSPKRREIGHGLLAERALLPVVPSLEEWAYTLRVVSEVLSSNGSTSMGSVCGSTLALMDGGVPIKAPVAGIAMGLIYDDGKYTTLTDILGTEDAFGDMDFKVAGTRDFVTALQLDTKIDGLPADVLAQALQQAKEARLSILDIMQKAIAEPRAEVGATAPKIVSFEIPIDKIGEVIGPKGKVINAIQAETGADISVDDDGMVGTVTIGSVEKATIDEAERQIKLILNPPTADVGAVYPGRVVNITKFGAFVNILPGRDGLLHISKIGGGKRIDKVEDVFNLGDEVEVKVDDVDPNGKVSLSLASAVDIPDSAVSSGGGGRRDVTAAARPCARDGALERRRAAPRSCPSRTASTPRPARSSAISAPPPPTAAAVEAASVAAATVAAAAAAAAAGVASPAHVTHLLDPGVEQTELPNGLRIVTETMPEARSVTLGAWVRVGGRDEPDELSGASHFLEHLLFKGTEQRSARQIAEAIDAVGGEMNAFTAREHTAFYARLPHERMALGVEMLADVLTAPALRPAEVEAERQVIVEEILMNLDAPEDRVHTALSRALFPDHPLGREVLGEMPTVEAITRDDIAAFFERWYRPATMVITAAGHLDHDDVVAAVARGFDGRSGRRAPRAGGARRGDGARRRRARRHRAGPPHPRLAQPHQPRRRPVGAVGGQPGARRRHVEPAVPGGARGARPGLLRVLAPHGVRRLRVPHDLLRHRAQARPRGPRRDRRRRRRGAGRRHHRAGARRRGRLPRGLDAPRARGQRQPHGPPRPQPHAARRDHADRRARRAPPRRHRSTTCPASCTGSSTRRARSRPSAPSTTTRLASP